MLISAHCNHLTLRGLRPSTITARRKVLTAYDNHLAGVPILDATRLHVEAFLARDLAPESRRAYRNHIASFYAWAIDEQYTSSDPTTRVPRITVPKALPRPMSSNDLARAMFRGTPRMRAWLTLMALAGLRCIEVSGLRPEDLSTSATGGPVMFLRECKGGGQAVLPCHPGILQALAVLPVRGGLWWTTTPQQVSRTVNVHLRSCGITSTAHSLRHRAGTDWYAASGHDLLVTASLLRHVNVSTTQTYAQLDPTRTAQVARLVTLPSVA